MDPATRIYSCDDHLDLPSVPPSLLSTFEEEPLGAQLIPHLGAGNCMWASDYPHTDGTFPNSMKAIDEALGGLPEEDRRKVTVTNCAELHGFTLEP